MLQRILCAGAFAGLVSLQSLAAMTYVPVSDDTLVRQAKLIVRAEPVEARAISIGDRVVTEYQFDALEVLKGEIPGSRLVVHVPGGALEDGSKSTILYGAPQFDVGQESLLFLKRSRGGTYRVLHFALGAFVAESQGSQRVWLHPSEAFISAVNLEGEMIDDRKLVRRAGDFEEWIAARSRGEEPTSDYFSKRRSSTRVAFTAPFTLLGPFDIDNDGSAREFVRWASQDDGVAIKWRRHTDGQPGLTREETKIAMRRATRAWRKKSSGAPIKVRATTWTTATGGFDTLDGRNTILFRDFNNDISDDFNCLTGGVLAVGGISGIFPSMINEWKGENFVAAAEAEIVINDGTACYYNTIDAAAEVYAHEIGHTLGIGHSCGDTKPPGARRPSPRCKDGDFADRALMRANAHNDGRGATLADDDRFAARFLYDPDFDAAFCRLPRPGAAKFCKRCGPCGEGQGNCQNDNQCAANLICVNGVGLDFGFDEGTNVCVSPSNAP